MNVAILANKIKESEKAILVEIKLAQGCNTFQKFQKWIPKSCASFDGANVVFIARWFFNKELNFGKDFYWNHYLNF
jgi:hypothetical protein